MRLEGDWRKLLEGARHYQGAVSLDAIHAPVPAHADLFEASIRVVPKCGFVIGRVRISPASERFAACEEAVLVLR